MPAVDSHKTEWAGLSLPDIMCGTLACSHKGLSGCMETWVPICLGDVGMETWEFVETP